MLKGCFVLFFCLFCSIFSGAYCFEINRVILSTDCNPKYLDFWPIAAPLWKAMGIRPTLALIGDEDVEVDTSIGDVIRFSSLKGVARGLQPQVIRLLLPALFPNDVCLVSDIDMLPISKEYFTEEARRCSEKGFLVYRDKGYGEDATRYPMCYVAGKGSVFSSVFRVWSRTDIDMFILWLNSMNLGWFSDEIILQYCVQDWKNRGGEVVLLGHGVERRLDREDWEKIDFDTLDVSKYIDCHCPRPYSAFKETIDVVVLGALKSLEESKE